MFPSDLSQFLPDSLEQCYGLLECFIANVEPMAKLIHRPTFIRRLQQYLHKRMAGRGEAARLTTMDDKTLKPFEPLVFVMFYAAVNSMKPSETLEKFHTERDVLLRRFREGLEISLEREGFLTTSSIEVLQAFVLLLVSFANPSQIDPFQEHHS